MRSIRPVWFTLFASFLVSGCVGGFGVSIGQDEGGGGVDLRYERELPTDGLEQGGVPEGMGRGTGQYL